MKDFENVPFYCILPIVYAKKNFFQSKANCPLSQVNKFEHIRVWGSRVRGQRKGLKGGPRVTTHCLDKTCSLGDSPVNKQTERMTDGQT